MSQAQFLLSEARLDQFTPQTAEGETPAPGGPLGFTLLVAEDPVLEPVAEQIAAQWTALGFAVAVQALPITDLQERLDAGLFDAALVEPDTAWDGRPGRVRLLARRRVSGRQELRRGQRPHHQ
ncbi:MAG: hypothetical protein HND48_07380 [Chloroflexi bacterium]|nr:hypothetical protein [Chloroflexota bacterium]